MSITTTPVRHQPAVSAADPQPRRWTREEFYRLAGLGFFEGQRAELWDGAIMVQSPQNWQHASTVDRVAEVLRDRLRAGFWVRMQLPLSLGLSTDPEPDVSVVTGRREDYSDHPTTAALVVEVSEASLRSDRTEKANLYAAGGVGEYWVLNLIDRQLEVFRKPVADTSQPFGHRYADVTAHRHGAVVAPTAAPQAAVAVHELLS